MEENESQNDATHSGTAGERLRRAREAAGLSRTDVASRTKVAERHLEAIEGDRFGDLAARTYAVGFSRSYARAVGLDEREIAEQVRAQLDAAQYDHHAPAAPTFEPGDPARVPPRGLAWLAAGAAVLVIGALLFFWSNYLSPEGELPSLLPEDEPSQVVPATAAPKPAVTPEAAATGPVVITSRADRLWIKVSDADGNQLFQKELAMGETWTLPADAKGPVLRTALPGKLDITVGGKPVAPFTVVSETVSGVSIAPADLIARGSGDALASASAGPAPASRVSSSPASATRRPAPSGTVSPSQAAPTAAATRAPVPSPRPSSSATRTAAPATASAPASAPAAPAAAPSAVSTDSD